MKRWMWAIAFWGLFLMLLCMVILGAMMQPKIVYKEKPFRMSPHTVQTGTPAAPTKVDKTSLIMQQNVNCWLAVVGATCGRERTYL